VVRTNGLIFSGWVMAYDVSGNDKATILAGFAVLFCLFRPSGLLENIHCFHGFSQFFSSPAAQNDVLALAQVRRPIFIWQSASSYLWSASPNQHWPAVIVLVGPQRNPACLQKHWGDFPADAVVSQVS